MGDSAEIIANGSGNVLNKFAQDPSLAVFLKENFDATSHASAALARSTASASTQALDEGIAALERELRSEVLAKHDELLTQVGSLGETESTLAVIRGGVANLQEAVQRVRAEIAEPYRQIQTRTRQLAALNETVDLLRRVLRMLKLIAKLREQLAGSNPDLAKVAKILSDIEMLKSEADLTGVDIVDAEAKFIASVGKDVRSKAEALLDQGMQSLSQAEVGSVLQVYYNLNELKPAVNLLVTKYVQQLTAHMATSLDPAKISSVSAAASNQGPGGGPGAAARAGGPQAGGAARWEQALWQQLASCMDVLHASVVAVWHLQRVTAKKRDPITHVCFLDDIVGEGEPTLTERLWKEVLPVVEAAMAGSYQAGSGVKEKLALSYPRVAALLDQTFSRILRDTDVKGVPAAVKPADRAELHRAVEVYQTAYLSRSLTKLTDAVSALFSNPGDRRGSGGTGVMGQAEVSKMLDRMRDELGAVSGDERLCELVAKGLSKSVTLLAEKTEYQMATGPDARQVAAACNPQQQRNLHLCVSLQEVQHGVAAMLPHLCPAAADVIKQALTRVQDVVRECLAPLMRAVGDRLEAALVKVHEEDFASEQGPATSNAASPYMQELLAAVEAFQQEFVQRMIPSTLDNDAFAISAELLRGVASRTVEMFVRHAALLRPLSEAGKLRLAKDMAELELSVGQNIFPVDQLGAAYRALRAFRPLLFLETAQVPSSPLLQELPVSVVLHHLYTRAPNELVSPYVRAGLTATQYSLWLDQHTEQEIHRGIKGTLTAYAQQAKSKNLQLSPVYTIMMDLIDQA